MAFGGGLITASALFGVLVVAGAAGLTWIVGEGEAATRAKLGGGSGKARAAANAKGMSLTHPEAPE